MMFKNSFKLLCANFDKVWKLLVYQILSWGILIGLLSIFYNTISSCLVSAWNSITVNGSSPLEGFLTSGTFYGVNIANALTAVCNFIIKFFELIFAQNLWIGLYIIAMFVLVRPILSGVGRFVVGEMMYGFMATSTKTSFTGTLLRTLNKSLPYALIRMLYVIPFDALIYASLFGLTIITHPVYAYAMPILVVLVPAALFAFKETFLACWAPAMIVYDCNVFRAYSKSMRATLRRGLRVYSTAFVIYLLSLVLTMVIGLYSLIIILPVIFPLIYIFEMVAFFSSQGMRFYSDYDTIVSPKKLEEVDKIEDAKYLL